MFQVRVDVADARERSRPDESTSEEAPSSSHTYTWCNSALQWLSEGVHTAAPRLETSWVNFRAGNPAIPSEIITGKVHLYRIVEAATGGRHRDAAPATLPESKPAPTGDLSSGDEVARAILQAKSAATGAEEDATLSASEDTAPTKSGSCSLDAHSAIASNGHSSTVSSSVAFGRRLAAASRAFGNTTVVSVLAVPSYMAPGDLAHFVAPFARRIRRMRILCDAVHPHRYMALLRFRCADDAILFSAEYDGRKFCAALGDDVCRVLPVAGVQFCCEEKQRRRFEASFAAAEQDDRSESGEASSSRRGNTAAARTDARDLPLPEALEAGPQAHEWPTCPVCLDRLDLESITASLCNHELHSKCLARWADPSCPVCRYTLPSVEPAITACSVCGTTEQLWMCLVCGHVGCGRYVQHHALAHYKRTHHVFSVELDTQRVWDYSGDQYVHRVVMDHLDGKQAALEHAPNDRRMPALAGAATTSTTTAVSEGAGLRATRLPGETAWRPPRSSASPDARAASSVVNGRHDPTTSEPDLEEEQAHMLAATIASKVDSVSQEYELLLASQLESQRIWYEDKAAAAKANWAQRVRELELQLHRQQQQIYRLQKQQQRERQEPPEVRSDRPAGSGDDDDPSACTQLQRLHALNERLLRDVQDYRAQVKRLQDEGDDLREQVRDLMHHLQAQTQAERATRSAPGSTANVSLVVHRGRKR